MKDKGRKAVKIMVLALSLWLIVRFTLIFRHQFPYPRYELKLFWSYRRPYLRREIILNYLLYVPFGFSLGLWRQKCWKALLICLILSGAMELIQLVWRLGLFEFDDIWGNTLGGMIGYLIAKAIFSIQLSRKR